MLWGSVFLLPLVLHDYPPAVLSFGRYLAFGVLCLALAPLARAALRALEPSDWREALRLAAVGNLLYYALLAAAIQVAGLTLPAMIIGTLPVVIALVANLGAEQPTPWRRLLPPLLLIAGGLALVHRDELRFAAATELRSPTELAWGALLAVGALACWTWYPIRNARWLARRPALRSSVWSTAQGLATLPLAAAAALVWLALGGEGLPGPRPLFFVLAMLAVGLGASWAGTGLWNRASRLLPASLAGQLIVFETLAALALGFLWRGQWPPAGTWAGIAMLVAGVAAGVRAFRS